MDKPAMIIELKWDKNVQGAIAQIEDKKYDTELLSADVTGIYKYGVAFSGKKVEVTAG